jgi:bifunctional enzyme CysN/CysC
MFWYTGSTLLGALDGFVSEKSPKDKPFRMPVQGVYKFTKEGDDRRIVAGTIETGILNVGDEVQFYPSGKKSRVKSIEVFNAEIKNSISAGYSTGFTLDEQIYVKRGDLAVISGQSEPIVTNKIRVNLFWLGKNPLEKNEEYYLKLGTSKVIVKLERILKVLDASSLDTKEAEKIERNEVAECILLLNKEIALDLSEEIANTGRFVIVDNYDIAGGGIVLESLESDSKGSLFEENNLAKNIVDNNYIIEVSSWEKSPISVEEREKKYKHKSALILVTGENSDNTEILSKELERKLFNEGNFVYLLKNNVLLCDDIDLRKQQFQQLAQISKIMIDAGTIIISPVSNLIGDDIKIIEEIIDLKTVKIISVEDLNKSFDKLEEVLTELQG